MITKAFSVYDSKAEMFHVPFFMNTTAAGMRAFEQLINDPNSMPAKYPGDFVLYEIGEFDDSSGTVSAYPTQKHLGIGSQFVKSPLPLKIGEEVH